MNFKISNLFPGPVKRLFRKAAASDNRDDPGLWGDLPNVPEGLLAADKVDAPEARP